MFFPDNPTLDLILRGLLLGPLAVVWITAVTKLVGLRTFSKVTAYDFVATIASGSLLAQAASATEWKQFIQTSIAVGAILGSQRLLAALRLRSDKFRRAIENEPILLMTRGTFHYKAMAEVRVTEADMWAKLRQASITKKEDVEAMILETTGNFSILQGSEIQEGILKHVERGPEYHHAGERAST